MKKTVYTCEKGKWIIVSSSELFLDFDKNIDSDCNKCEYRQNAVCELKKVRDAYLADCDIDLCLDTESWKDIEDDFDQDIAYISRLQNLKSPRWSFKELNAIYYCNDAKEAYEQYISKFGCIRSKKAISNQWKRNHLMNTFQY